ncbi:VOC family protein [Parasphingorhabdus sp.]|uniref:VOC family protein n=1 Tax=Parasphingorhabdus sp. TaxID=2709688 RepID=UPI003A8CA848
MTETTRERPVWVEIPATDLNRARKFYEAVFETKLIENNDGPEKMLMIPSANDAMCGHLYVGEPATQGDGITAHLSVQGTLAEAMDRITASSGEVVSETISIPSGAFFYARDTEGNSLGVFRYKV